MQKELKQTGFYHMRFAEAMIMGRVVCFYIKRDDYNKGIIDSYDPKVVKMGGTFR